MRLENISNSKQPIDAETSPMVSLSGYIAPWALPKEEVPIHMVWNPVFKFDFIQILLPPHIEVKEFLNVESYEIVNSCVFVKSIRSPNFFGLVVRSNEMSKNQHERKEIVVKFIRGNRVQHAHSFIANIYRPELSVVGKPESIVLRDDSDLRNLVNLALKISGFGRIEITTEVSVGGQFQPDLDPLYREIVRKLITSFRLTESHPEKKKEIEINPLYLQQTAKTFIDKMKKGELPFEIRENDLKDLHGWLADEENQTKVVELVSEQLESILIDSLLFYFDRYPTEGIELIGGKPMAIIQSATHTVRLKFRYKDSLGNEYEPIPVEIPIQDLRKEKKSEPKVPINISWVHEQINPNTEGANC